jgi:hypothetical protein
MKAKMGVMERDLRESFIRYKQDGDLLLLLKAIVSQSDGHIFYAWQYTYFLNRLEKVYGELMRNENPSHRRGQIDAVSS